MPNNQQVVAAAVVVTSAVVVSAALVIVSLSDTAGAVVPVPHPERSKAAAAAKDISFDVFLISDLRCVKNFLYYIKRIKRQKVTLFSEFYSFLYSCTIGFVNNNQSRLQDHTDLFY